MARKLVFALQVLQAEETLASMLPADIAPAGSAAWREAVLPLLEETGADILLYREELRGSADTFELMAEIRRKCPGVQIIFLAAPRSLPSSLLSRLVCIGIYDILCGEAIPLQEMVDCMVHPRDFSQASVFLDLRLAEDLLPPAEEPPAKPKKSRRGFRDLLGRLGRQTNPAGSAPVLVQETDGEEEVPPEGGEEEAGFEAETGGEPRAEETVPPDIPAPEEEREEEPPAEPAAPADPPEEEPVQTEDSGEEPETAAPENPEEKSPSVPAGETRQHRRRRNRRGGKRRKGTAGAGEGGSSAAPDTDGKTPPEELPQPETAGEAEEIRSGDRPRAGPEREPGNVRTPVKAETREEADAASSPGESREPDRHAGMEADPRTGSDPWLYSPPDWEDLYGEEEDEEDSWDWDDLPGGGEMDLQAPMYGAGDRRETVAFAGAVRGCGCTCIALDTAVELARSGYRVCYVELGAAPSSLRTRLRLQGWSAGTDDVIAALGEGDFHRAESCILRPMAVQNADGPLRRLSARLPPGLHFLLRSSSAPEYSRIPMTRGRMEELRSFLAEQQGYGFVLLDLQADDSAAMDAALYSGRGAGKLVLVLDQDPCALAAATRIITRTARSAGRFLLADAAFAVNGFDPGAKTGKRKIESQLGLRKKTVVWLPEDRSGHLKAAAAGLPYNINGGKGAPAILDLRLHLIR